MDISHECIATYLLRNLNIKDRSAFICTSRKIYLAYKELWKITPVEKTPTKRTKITNEIITEDITGYSVSLHNCTIGPITIRAKHVFIQCDICQPLTIIADVCMFYVAVNLKYLDLHVKEFLYFYEPIIADRYIFPFVKKLELRCVASVTIYTNSEELELKHVKINVVCNGLTKLRIRHANVAIKATPKEIDFYDVYLTPSIYEMLKNYNKFSNLPQRQDCRIAVKYDGINCTVDTGFIGMNQHKIMKHLIQIADIVIIKNNVYNKYITAKEIVQYRNIHINEQLYKNLTKISINDTVDNRLLNLFSNCKEITIYDAYKITSLSALTQELVTLNLTGVHNEIDFSKIRVKNLILHSPCYRTRFETIRADFIRISDIHHNINVVDVYNILTYNNPQAYIICISALNNECKKIIVYSTERNTKDATYISNRMICTRTHKYIYVNQPLVNLLT